MTVCMFVHVGFLLSQVLIMNVHKHVISSITTKLVC